MASNLAIAADQFETEVLKSDQPVLVDFWATWCGPCLRIAPAIEQIAEEMAGQAKVFKIDVDQNQDLAAQHSIMSIPALIVFKDGKEVDRLVGAGSKDDIKALLQKHV